MLPIVKRYWFYTVLVYSLFVIYGSLVPFDFQLISLEDAQQRFEELYLLDLREGSRVDRAVNVLLFIPLAFMWMGLLSASCVRAGKVLVSVYVALFCLLLSFCIEFAQLFFPSRVSSFSDIFAQCIGTAIGISAWWLTGRKVIEWLAKWQLTKLPETRLDRYLEIYIGFLFFYNVMPLDLIMSPIDFYHKWNEGRIILFPFGGLKELFAENIYEWGSEILLWIPVPLLWQRRGGLGDYQILGRVFGLVVTLEFIQLFVNSRVTDTTDILLAMVGGVLGLWVGRRLFSERADIESGILFSLWHKRLVVGSVGYLLWYLLLIIVFWYPFDFNLSRDYLDGRLESLFKVPFHTYFYSTEFRALTEIFHKVVFFMPLGWILAFIARSIGSYRLLWVVSLFILSASALTIEAVQLLLPGKVVSWTDLFLEVAGGQLGFILGRAYFLSNGTQRVPQKRQTNVIRTEFSVNNRNEEADKRTGWRESSNTEGAEKRSYFFQYGGMSLLLGLLVMTTFLSVASHSSSVPYNIRELIDGDYLLLRAFALSLSMFWCFGFPLFYLSLIGERLRPILSFFYGICIHSFFAWFLIRLSVPLESIHDIVGSPVLSIPSELEIFIRFFMLFMTLSLALFGGLSLALTQLGLRGKVGVHFFQGSVLALIILPACYWVIVVQAATDNLTELMMDNGSSFAVIGFFGYMLLIGMVGSFLSAIIGAKVLTKTLVWTMGLLLVSFPVGYGLLDWATESVILKYGVVYSAMQFLLSPDRVHFVTGSDLFIRFCWANTALILLVCFSQLPFWKSLRFKPAS